MTMLKNIIQPEGNNNENLDRNSELAQSNSCNKSNTRNNNILKNLKYNENEDINRNRVLSNNIKTLTKNNNLLDEIADISSETTTNTSPTKNVANKLIKELLCHSISSNNSQNSVSQDYNYRPLLLSITEDGNSSVNENFLNSPNYSYQYNNVNENIKRFLKEQGIINNNENEYEDNIDMDEYEDEDNDDEEYDEYEEYEEEEEEEEDDDEEEEEEDDDDDIETEFLDSEYEFDEYATYGYNGEFELNKSLGIITDENISEYEYKNMIDVLRNLSYVVSKMRNERDEEKLSIKNFDSIMNEIKYSQKTCSEILLKAERISNKYSASMKELNELQEKFEKQNEKYKEEINQMNKKIQLLRNEIKNNNIKGKIFNNTEKLTNLILIIIFVIIIYIFLFILMSSFNVQQYTKPYIDRYITYCNNFSLKHDNIRLFNNNLKLYVNYLYNSYEHFVLKAIDAVQNLKIAFHH
ncbi:hypothetical protein BCR36DRAFT_578895 [Piromyces finnis]|uniref:Uncharacterized protein n=1 Tax=Piromyces finnis TaxID=1754191 RepID=A0A1Y1VNU6_9FUNG|nr:hypothetical protein BCR36DRAFT_578895 [Piromyces finnis]|eukprot:ORX60823.1 hypothetical protein BCR36DRAFT_578895 [Piromyces finnis]